MAQILEFTKKEEVPSDPRWEEEKNYFRKGQLDKALEVLEELAAEGYVAAYGQIGILLELGRGGVTQDFEGARYWYMRAIGAMDDEYAYVGMARLALKGYKDAGTVFDAVDYLRRACETENPIALTLLGTLYHQGEGVEKDFKQADQLYERAIAQGYVIPMAYLAKLKFQKGHIISGLYWHFKTIWTAYRIARKDAFDERLSNYM